MAKQEKPRGRMTIPTVVDIETKPDGSTIPVYDEAAHYALADEDDLCGGGQPMKLSFLKKSIQKHLDKLDKDYELLKSKGDADSLKASRAIEDDSIAITLGKESLMLLLSQKDCEAIRFYFCKNPFGRNSVAAVGVCYMKDEYTGAYIRDEDDQIRTKDIGTKDAKDSLMASNNIDENMLSMEVGPPYTFIQLKMAGAKHGLKEDSFIKSMRESFKNR